MRRPAPGTTTEKLRSLRLRVVTQIATCLEHAMAALTLESALLGEILEGGEVELIQTAGQANAPFAAGHRTTKLNGLLGRLRHDQPLFSRDLSGESWVGEDPLPPGVRACVAIPLRAGSARYLGLLYSGTHRRRGFSDQINHSVDLLASALTSQLERLAVEEELRRGEERFRRFFHLSKDGTAMVRPDGRFATVNDVLSRLLGCSRLQLLQRTWQQLTHPEDLEGEQELFDAVIAGEREGYQIEKRFMTQDGRTLVSKVSTRALRRSDGQADRLIVFVEDQTERRAAVAEQERLQLQLLQAQKLEGLGVMAAGIAHDFNNLLTGVIGNAHLLQVELSLAVTNPARASLDALLSAAERAAALTQQLLAYSGKGARSLEPADLSYEVQQMSELLNSLTPKKVELRLDLGVELPQAQVDVNQLQQVVMNLVLNGAEAVGEEGGTVWIRTGAEFVDPFANGNWVLPPSQEGRYAWVEVLDTGQGMDAATLSRVFDPFFTTKRSGRGLGLAAVLGIARGHGGALLVQSDVGRGSLFRVYFPSGSVTSGEIPLDLEHRPEPTPSSSGPVILVIDDAEVVRTFCRKSLEQRGFEVVVAASGSEGIAAYRRLSSAVSLVVLDMSMPDMDGVETYQELAKIEPEVRVLFVSGNAEAEMRRRLVGVEGAVGFLPKPFAPKALADEVEQNLRP